jgi:cobalamin biosynthesis Mg chelatase CobN
VVDRRAFWRTGKLASNSRRQGVHEGALQEYLEWFAREAASYEQYAEKKPPRDATMDAGAGLSKELDVIDDSIERII